MEPTTERVLLVEDDPARIAKFKRHFIGRVLDVATNAEGATAFLKHRAYTEIYLDHDLAPHHYEAYIVSERNHEQASYTVGRYDHETSYAVAKLLADNPTYSPDAEILVHSIDLLRDKTI